MALQNIKGNFWKEKNYQKQVNGLFGIGQYYLMNYYGVLGNIQHILAGYHMVCDFCCS